MKIFYVLNYNLLINFRKYNYILFLTFFLLNILIRKLYKDNISI